jgi:hypothetical protein
VSDVDWLPGDMSREFWIGLAVVVGLVGLLTLYGAFRIGKKLFVTKRMLGELGAGGKFAFYGALLYAIFPIDILPDPIYLDDMAVLGGALFYLNRLLRSRGGLKGMLPHRQRPATPPAPTPVRKR